MLRKRLRWEQGNYPDVFSDFLAFGRKKLYLCNQKNIKMLIYMKTKRMIMLLVLILLGATAMEAQTYTIAVGDQVKAAADVEDNGLYALYNPRNNKCMYENDAHALLLLGGLSINDLQGTTNTNAVFRLKSNGDGTYKIQNYVSGRYLPVPTGNGNISTSETGGSYDLNFQSDGNIFPRCTSEGVTYGLDHTTGGVYSYTTLNTTNGSAQNYRLYRVALEEYVEPEGLEVVTLNNTNSSRGALMYAPSQSEKWVWSSGKNNQTFSSSDRNCQWVFYPAGSANAYYLYNLGAGKFAIPTTGGNYNGYSWVFSDDAVAVTMSTQSDGTKKIFTTSGNIYVSVSNGYTGPIINYNDVGAQFTMAVVGEADDAIRQQVETAVGRLIHNTTPLSAVPGDEGWYAIRIRKHDTYTGQFVYTLDEETTYNGTDYPLGFYSAAMVRPAVNDARYFTRLTKSSYGYYWQLPNGRYVQNGKPVSGVGESSVTVGYEEKNGFVLKGGSYYFVPYLLGGAYFIGETSSAGRAYYDLYPISLAEAGLTAWQVVSDGAPETARVSCKRSDVSGLTSVYNKGYFFLPTGVVPEAGDFSMPGSKEVTVDAEAKTVTIGYDPRLAVTPENIVVSQGYGTTGRGSEKAVLLRMEVNPFQQMENAVMTFDLTNAEAMEKVTLYETGNTVEFLAQKSFLRELEASVDGSLATVKLGTVEKGRHYYWLCATVSETLPSADASQEESENVIDAAATGLSYDYNGFEGTLCDLTATGNPQGSMKIFDVQSHPFVPTTYGSNVYRIPALCVAKDGSIVAAADKRYGSSADIGGGHLIDIVARRSTDGGRTWSEPVVVAKGQGSGNDAKCGYGDPSLTVGKDGRLYCLFAAGNTGYFYGLNRICMSTSDDNGQTWSEPVDLKETGRIKDHTQYGLFDYFVTSGKGLYTNDGVLMYLLPAQCYTDEKQTGHISNSNDYVFYSTDDGETWHISREVVFTGGDEAKLEQTDDGRLIASVRRAGARGFNFGTYTKNTDGTLTFKWGTQSTNSQLSQQSANNQDIIYYARPKDGGQDVILHTMTTGAHKNLKLYKSTDQGKKWEEVMQVQAGGSRYVVMTVLENGDLGLLFEDYSLETGIVYPLTFLSIPRKELVDDTQLVVQEPTSTPSLKGKEGVYDLQGRRVGQGNEATEYQGSLRLPKGIYIQNGRKIVVK